MITRKNVSRTKKENNKTAMISGKQIDTMDGDAELLNSSFSDDIEKVDVEAVSNLIVKEMSQLSLKEQYIIGRDINGMNILAAAEPFELSSMGLKALDKQLEMKIGDSAFHQSPEHLRCKMIKDVDFRLKFARAESFDPVRAANRLENYLKIVQKHFGDENLKRTIKLTDLDKVCFVAF